MIAFAWTIVGSRRPPQRYQQLCNQDHHQHTKGQQPVESPYRTHIELLEQEIRWQAERVDIATIGEIRLRGVQIERRIGEGRHPSDRAFTDLLSVVCPQWYRPIVKYDSWCHCVSPRVTSEEKHLDDQAIAILVHTETVIFQEPIVLLQGAIGEGRADVRRNASARQQLHGIQPRRQREGGKDSGEESGTEPSRCPPCRVSERQSHFLRPPMLPFPRMTKYRP